MASRGSGHRMPVVSCAGSGVDLAASRFLRAIRDVSMRVELLVLEFAWCDQRFMAAASGRKVDQTGQWCAGQKPGWSGQDRAVR